MEQPTEMTTLSQILEKLRLKGVDNEIKMNDDKEVVSENLNKTYKAEDLLIFKTFRFEGDSDPADNAVLYIAEDKEGNIGYILDAYGTYSNHEGPEFDDFIKNIKVEDRDEQELFG
ncbi:hypothetical protein [Niabella ginsengisoli]|uniref:Phosphoribosylpyrophosphate synthetase n=1 Tax=Niabella ginsengisoli TaxID=522298 RepID=A0ABS9SLZ1_9BACT|nr:hypothetical protein [Niabella ginsengisoli]MCH5599399.1 hypothetical protein [Niabella ginsengisoli]